MHPNTEAHLTGAYDELSAILPDGHVQPSPDWISALPELRKWAAEQLAWVRTLPAHDRFEGAVLILRMGANEMEWSLEAIADAGTVPQSVARPWQHLGVVVGQLREARRPSGAGPTN